jgi:hypothetical protein
MPRLSRRNLNDGEPLKGRYDLISVTFTAGPSTSAGCALFDHVDYFRMGRYSRHNPLFDRLNWVEPLVCLFPRSAFFAMTESIGRLRHGSARQQ